LSSEREAEKAAFLRAHGLGEVRRVPLDQDASTRRYERLHLKDGSTLIFMDQPQALESLPCPPEATVEERASLGFNALYRLAAGRVDAFLACAGWLNAQGLSAPKVVAADPEAGLAVLEDLGPALYAAILAEGGPEAELYDAAIDALVHLHSVRPPAVLEANAARWPLLAYDAAALKFGHDLFVDWLPKLKPELAFDEEARAAYDAAWAPIRARGEAGAAVFCHRDYHAENLIWLPERKGVARVGMIDFQDALLAHPAWDLSMLLHDARRQIAPELEAAALDRYLAARPELDREQFLGDYRALGALNIMRILGIFSRLVTRDSKPKYRAFMPRMWAYLDRCLDAPALAEIKAWLDAYVPREARG
jgi:aminoglycoside/choline kinase family phosphotransferase